MSKPDEMEFLQASSYHGDSSELINTPPIVRRPIGGIFTSFYALKVLPFIVYLFCGIFFSSSVFQWVLAIITSAVDFWFTKNVAGRLIVGMRWNNIVNQDGESEWKFEYANKETVEKFGYKKTFWGVLFVSAGVWGLFSFFNLIRLNLGWLFVTSISTSLAVANAWGFLKCDRSVNDEIQNSAQSLISNKLLPMLFKSGSQPDNNNQV